MARVWVTRARPGAEATAARLVALGHEPVVEPLLTVRGLDFDPDLTGVAALAFTSRNGVAAFASRQPDRSLPVFAVGAATALAAREAGFIRVRDADGDVAALAALIAREHPAGLVLHPGPAQPAGDLAGALALQGLAARSVVVYETVQILPNAAFLGTLEGLDAVLLHSARAAQALAAMLETVAAPTLRACCLSEAVARPLAPAVARGGLASVAYTPRPDESALFALLDP